MLFPWHFHIEESGGEGDQTSDASSFFDRNIFIPKHISFVYTNISVLRVFFVSFHTTPNDTLDFHIAQPNESVILTHGVISTANRM